MDGERRFLERLAELLPRTEDLKSTTVRPRVRVIDERRPSFLLQGGCLVQVEVVYPDKTMVFWCLFFDRETDAVVELFLNREKSIQDVIERRFVEPLVERLKGELLPTAEDPGPLTVPRQVGVIDVRTPSFLQDGYLAQVEIVYPDKTKVFWCLFFDSEKDAVVEPFLNHKTSVPEIIERVEKARGAECIRIDPETVRDYVMEFINYELAYAGEAGLLVNDLE